MTVFIVKLSLAVCLMTIPTPSLQSGFPLFQSIIFQSDLLLVPVHPSLSISIYLSLNKVTVIQRRPDMSAMHWSIMLKANYVCVPVVSFHSIPSPVKYAEENLIRLKEKIRKEIHLILAMFPLSIGRDIVKGEIPAIT